MLQSDSKIVRTKIGLLCALLGLLSVLLPVTRAETISISLSQEQDGGEAGRACIYIYQGKAEFRVVKPDESCAAQITVESHRS